MDINLQAIYNKFRDMALAAGFTFDQWWREVMRFIKDEFDADSASWAIAAELAYENLLDESRI